MASYALIYNQTETIIIVANASSNPSPCRSNPAISGVLRDMGDRLSVQRRSRDEEIACRLMYRLTVASCYQTECPTTRLIGPMAVLSLRGETSRCRGRTLKKDAADTLTINHLSDSRVRFDNDFCPLTAFRCMWARCNNRIVRFLPDRTNGRAIGTVLRLSVCLTVTLSIVANRCVLEQKLLLTAYMRNRLVPN